MKRRIVIILITLIVFNNAISQTFIENYQKYFQKGDFLNAKKEIETASQDASNSSNPLVWLKRSEVNSVIYSNNMQDNQSCLEIAYMSVMKASFLDSKKTYNKDIFSQLNFVSQLYYKKGANDFNNQKYNVSILSFERSIEIDNLMNLPQNNEKYYYTGLASGLSKNSEKTKKYFTPLFSNNYPKVEVYSFLSDIYKAENNNSQAIEILKKGIKLLPNNSYQLIVNIVKLFLNIGFTSEALEYLQIGTNMYQNDELYYLQGSLNLKLNQEKQAIYSFQKAININPNNFDASYNLGILLYNSSINHLKVADSFVNSNPSKYNSEKEIFLDEIKKSAPLLEKALVNDANNKILIQCLLDVYKRLQRKEQYNKLLLVYNSMK